MTSHIRHRRGGVPPVVIEPGELALDTANRALAAGNLGDGTPLQLLAVRVFSTSASYAINDYAVHGADIVRANVAIAPGPFNASQWTVLVGSVNVDAGHTPLQGFSDGFSQTLILHGINDLSSSANTILFRNASNQQQAMIFTSGAVGSPLQLNSGGSIILATGAGGFGANPIVEIGSGNAFVYNRGPNETLVLRNMVGPVANALDFQNAAGTSVGNLSEYGGALWVQSAGVINFTPNHVAFDGGGIATRLDTAGMHLFQTTPSSAYNSGALVVDGGAGVAGNLNVGGAINAPNGSISIGGGITMGVNYSLQNAGGYMVVQSAAALYLRSPTLTYINDNSNAPTIVGGALGINGVLNANQGAVIANNLTVYQSSAPATAVINLGSPGAQLVFNGTDLQLSSSARLVTSDPVAAQHAATKNYVDGQLFTYTGGIVGPYLPTRGGTMTGQIVGSGSNGLTDGGSISGSILVTGAGPTWAAMSFLVPGLFGTNLGLKTDGNFYMGGNSHGATAYQFWTKRDFAQVPIDDVRLAFAADVGMDVGVAVPADPYPGAVVSGITQNVTTTPAQTFVRYRYLQIKLGSTWVTVATT